MNIAGNVRNSACSFPQRTALIHAQRQMNFSELDIESNKVASALVQSGVLQGDHVALLAQNSCEWITTYFGVLKAGAVAVTLPCNITSNELIPILEDCKPKVIFTHDGDLVAGSPIPSVKTIVAEGGDITYKDFLSQGDPAFTMVDKAPDDTGVILYTGGTTGKPKGVMLSHRNIVVAAANVARSEKSAETDVALCFLPLNHVFGQVHVMNATILTAGCLVLQEGFHLNDMLNGIKQHKVTRLYAVPTVYCRLLSLPDVKEMLATVRYCFSAAASMAQEVIQEWKKITGLEIFEAYGMTETTSMVTYNHYEKHVPGSVGTPVEEVRILLIDANGNPVAQGEKGEICISGPTVMKNYLNHEQDREKYFMAQWFRSGDIGVMDENGYLYIVDRIKEIIITGGENVHPREVEEILYKCHEIEECAVIGIPDKEYGERIIACIVTRGNQSLDPIGLKKFLKERLSPFKIPKDFLYFADLPRSRSGKLLKRELRNQIITSSLPGLRPPGRQSQT